MIRIADAAGVGGMVVCAQSVDPYNPKTVRSTAGSLFHIPLSVGDDVSETTRKLKGDGYKVYAADAHNGTGLWETEWPEKLAVVMGNEAWGLSPEEELLADELIRVEVFGKAESLNVSAAAAVILYEVRRRRLKGIRS
jgi:TrmH family RNA methyltransferase